MEITKPAGRISVKPIPVSDPEVFVFWIVKLNEVDPPTGMLAAPNEEISAGAITLFGFVTVTTAVACAVAPFVSVTVSVTVVLPCG